MNRKLLLKKYFKKKLKLMIHKKITEKSSTKCLGSKCLNAGASLGRLAKSQDDKKKIVFKIHHHLGNVFDGMKFLNYVTSAKTLKFRRFFFMYRYSFPQ